MNELSLQFKKEIDELILEHNDFISRYSKELLEVKHVPNKTLHTLSIKVMERNIFLIILEWHSGTEGDLDAILRWLKDWLSLESSKPAVTPDRLWDKHIITKHLEAMIKRLAAKL